MSPDWSFTVLEHNRTCCRKYRILLVLIDLCESIISEFTHNLPHYPNHPSSPSVEPLCPPLHPLIKVVLWVEKHIYPTFGFNDLICI